MEEAARQRALSRAIREIKARNANADVNELQALVVAVVGRIKTTG